MRIVNRSAKSTGWGPSPRFRVASNSTFLSLWGRETGRWHMSSHAGLSLQGVGTLRMFEGCKSIRLHMYSTPFHICVYTHITFYKLLGAQAVAAMISTSGSLMSFYGAPWRLVRLLCTLSLFCDLIGAGQESQGSFVLCVNKSPNRYETG